MGGGRATRRLPCPKLCRLVPTDHEPPGDVPRESSPITPGAAVHAPVDRARGLLGVPRVALDALRVAKDAAPRNLAIALGLQILSAVLLAAQLFVLKRLVVGLVNLAQDDQAPVGDVLPAFAGVVGLTLAIGVVAAVLQREQRMLAEHVGRRTLDRVIDVACRVELAKFENPVFHDQLQRATQASTFRPVEMINALMALLLGVVTSLGVMVALATLEPLLLPMVLLAGVPVLLATLQNSRQTYTFEYGMTTNARERVHLLDLFVERDSAKELRIFDAAPFLRRRYDALSDERISRMTVFVRQRLKVSILGTLASSLGSAIALLTLVWLLASGRIGFATAATAAVAMQVLATRLAVVTGSLGRLVESGLFLDDLRTFLALGVRQDVTDAARPAGGPGIRSFERLEVNGLSFTYPGTKRRVLDDVSLDIGHGEVIAIVGENGSGKTTLVKLLCQLYVADRGAIRLNGADVTEIDPQQLRSAMTVLFQDFVQYHLSASDNIVLGRPEREQADADVQAAARQAGAHEIVERLPAGYKTRLGRHFDGGHELSGGEWQRLALARAFYRGGDFLIMDEPTAALDPRAEHRLFEQIRELAAGKSVLLISHRFANVRMADRIYVMERGRVIESGSHDELMQLDRVYAELFALQAASYLEAPSA